MSRLIQRIARIVRWCGWRSLAVARIDRGGIRLMARARNATPTDDLSGSGPWARTCARSAMLACVPWDRWAPSLAR